MSEIFDFTKPLNVAALDRIVLEAFDPQNEKKEESEQILVEFKEHPNSWSRVDTILKESSNPKTHFFALQILENAVKTRWFLFSMEQRNGLKTYVVQFILETSAQKENYILKRFNIILVEILKKEWPKNWPSFISDLLNASKTISMNVCRNSLEILKRLNEEIFEFSNDITTSKKILLQNQFKTEYIQIFQLIKAILESPNSMDSNLIETTFSAFISFCKKMGKEFLYNTNIIELICSYLNSPHSISSIQCLREIIESNLEQIDIIDMNDSMVCDKFEKINTNEENYVSKMILMNREVVNFCKLYMEKFNEVKIHKAFNELDPLERDFIRELAYFFSLFYENNLLILEKHDLPTLKEGIEILTKFCRINDSRIFKKSIIFFNFFIINLYEEFPFNTQPKKVLRRDNYKNILDSLIDIIVIKMPRPEEVFVTVNEYGEVIKEKLTEVEKIEFFHKIKETLYHLASINQYSTKSYFFGKLDRLLSNPTIFTHEHINHICWATGCISGSFSEEEEYNFFVTILKDLLALCEIKQTKQDKAIIASNIIYIIGQYYRFLLSYLSFLKVLIKKIFEFLHEEHEGIKDMACDTFLRICDKCSVKFPQMEENKQNLVLWILKHTKEITCDLEHYQKRIIYQSFVKMIQNAPLAHRAIYLDMLFNSFSDINILNPQFYANFSFDDYTIKETSHIIKSYSLVFKEMPDSSQLCDKGVLPFLVDFYNKISTSDFNKKSKELLKNDLINLFISVIHKDTPNTFLDLIFKNVIIDFKNEMKKNYLILNLGSEIIKNIEIDYNQESFLIYQLINVSTFNCDENVGLAMSYFSLVQCFMSKRFNSFFNSIFSDSFFNNFMDIIVNGLSSLKDVSDKCLELLNDLLVKLMDLKIYIFFKNYYFLLLENIIGLLFDKDKRFNFNLQVKTFCILIRVLSTCPPLGEGRDNYHFVGEFLIKMLCGCFPNLTKESVELFVTGLFDLFTNERLFGEHVSDFRIKVYEFGTNEDYQDELNILQLRKSQLLKEV
ncbi:hypothetical protein H312_02335 [Anncaliia algerae PRA339]|uniref:Importin N-terminal domain-containing protein n=1 Tax=Anncaliia algerae PRA339 TaxID=1288291 RepID=A0A059EZI2_9MICR|nr:hypothetical protein H312_02335 [Anncaliia algerae PRA339]